MEKEHTKTEKIKARLKDFVGLRQATRRRMAKVRCRGPIPYPREGLPRPMPTD